VCECVVILPEAAGIVFGGGFPREGTAGARRAAQRAIYFVQRELEAYGDAREAGVVLCDRGMIDGAAYWPGPEDFWAAIGSARDDVLKRYHAVIHLRVPGADDGYGRHNPLRTESAEEALAIDERIFEAWSGHPRRHVIPASEDFMTKVAQSVEALKTELPAPCSEHLRVGVALTPHGPRRS
jgi:hypothetical protein